MNEEWFTEHGGLLFWGVMLGGVVAFAISYLFYWLTVRPKKVDWLPISATSILAVRENQRPALKDLHVVIGDERKDIDNPNLVLLRIMNTGLQTVTQGDFDPAIRFKFDDGSMIRASVIDQAKKTATITLDDVTVQGCMVEVSSLDKGHWFDVQFITNSQEPKYPEVLGEVMGRRPNGSLRRLEADQKSDRIIKRIAWVAFSLVVVTSLVASNTADSNGKSRLNPVIDNGLLIIFAVSLILFLASMLALAESTVKAKRIKRRMRS